ncbi:MAG TPA: acetyl-CoA carboxylase biotin carboxylase subunit [Acidobacteriota bacterium]|nr:acetyl-CoA carboxylase biotin carboxylase subunit [Acidobacteriota bacterium]
MNRIFIANRGEIAVRIIRACREMGKIAVVGYSEADRSSLAVRLADEAILLGPSPSSESYLNIPRIIECIQQTKCEAVHPGYGFLSERSAFAAACEKAGIIFIGPKSDVIELMGNKTQARQAVTRAGTPVVPGTLEPIREVDEALRLANEFGYPVMIKASAGGGGKGLRHAWNPAELESAFQIAQSEALAAFGDASVYLEKKILDPHHVEIQVLADHFGNVIHLGERECSIQRRHQKVIEECPSPFISNATREKMCAVAVRAAKDIGYTNAGTMEFLVDADQNFYFLEMNTRVQVEHPTTEMVTGVDIVKEQICIASGERLQFRQEDIVFRGAAIECRIYAEDAEHNFMPSPGKILTLRTPGGPGIRDDSGIYQGFEVPIFYDPLLSKLVAWGRNREEAIERMRRALEEYLVAGIKTTIPFYQRVLRDPSFQKGNVTTSFIEDFFTREKISVDGSYEHIALAAAAISEYQRLTSGTSQISEPSTKSTNAWKILGRKEGLRE